MNRRTPLRARVSLARRTPLRTSREKRTGRRDTGLTLHVKAIVDERDDWHCACCGTSVWGRPYSRQRRVDTGPAGVAR